jgi:hypothetical protein
MALFINAVNSTWSCFLNCFRLNHYKYFAVLNLTILGSERREYLSWNSTD